MQGKKETLKQNDFVSLYSLLKEEDRLLRNIHTFVVAQDEFLKMGGYIPDFVPEELEKAKNGLAEVRTKLRKYLKDFLAETI